MLCKWLYTCYVGWPLSLNQKANVIFQYFPYFWTWAENAQYHLLLFLLQPRFKLWTPFNQPFTSPFRLILVACPCDLKIWYHFLAHLDPMRFPSLHPTWVTIPHAGCLGWFVRKSNFSWSILCNESKSYIYLIRSSPFYHTPCMAILQ